MRHPEALQIKNYIHKVLSDHRLSASQSDQPHLPSAFAPTNIALCKYWGKRDAVLNLPLTNSLSISLGKYGAVTHIAEIDAPMDALYVNGQAIHEGVAGMRSFRERLSGFLDHVRPTPATAYRIETDLNIPIAAGLASSACGFAALVGALNGLYQWNLSKTGLSMLARLGSGSACRSLWDGFVEWERGERVDGLDSVGVPLDINWPEFRVGLLMVNQQQKPISSRVAMQRTQDTSPFYCHWPKKVEQDLQAIKAALHTRNFQSLARTSELNALALHALMMTANPPIVYTLAETMDWMHRIWQCRTEGLEVYFTQDAGPNLKLLFLEADTANLKQRFPDLKMIAPFLVDKKDD